MIDSAPVKATLLNTPDATELSIALGPIVIAEAWRPANADAPMVVSVECDTDLPQLQY